MAGIIRDATPTDAADIAALLKPYVEKKILLHRSLDEIRENADKTVVYLDQGRIVERGETAAIFRNPQHPTTRALIAAHEGEPAPASATVTAPSDEPEEPR